MLKKFQKHRLLLAVVFSIFLLGLTLVGLKYSPEQQTSQNGQLSQENELNAKADLFELKKNETFHQLLSRAGIEEFDITSILSISQGQVPFSMLRSGQKIEFYTSAEETKKNYLKIQLHSTDVESWLWEKDPKSNVWAFSHHKETPEYRLMSFSGTVTNSLWNSARESQMDPYLISEMTEIFAWQVDFAREVRVNDKWRITVEQKIVRGRPTSWGRIVAAEYNNAGNLYTALLFVKNGEEIGYFTPEGKSLKKIFLKSPIKYSRISSHFNRRRFHPLLKFVRPHLGVDYAAPYGTEIRAVGDGVVTFAEWNGGGGKTIKIRHNSTYSTHYKHLSRFASNLRSGTKVKQGQVIGYVGSTGMSTGPHLHFEFWENNRYVDPLGKSFPVANPIPSHLMSEFVRRSSLLLESLPHWLDSKILESGNQAVSQNISDRIFAEALN